MQIPGRQACGHVGKRQYSTHRKQVPTVSIDIRTDRGKEENNGIKKENNQFITIYIITLSRQGHSYLPTTGISVLLITLKKS
jgi:hypothetical protein